MSFIITISREYGSGGRYIGSRIAEKLGIKFYDNELLEKAAESAGYSIDFIKENDEKKDSFFSYGYNVLSNEMLSSTQRVASAQFQVIEKLAQTETCVIIGRCADYILRNYTKVVNVFIYAPLEDKIKRAVNYYNLDEKKASERIRKIDKNRTNYYNFFSDRKWGKKENYDICLNSSIGIDETADIIIEYAKKKLNLNNNILKGE